MSSVLAQRLETLGTLCRRSSALLSSLAAPIVLIVFVATSIMVAAVAARPTPGAAPLPLDSDVQPAVSRAARFRITPRRALSVAASVLAATLFAAGAAGGTYAYLNAQATTPAITVSSGSLVVTVQAAGTAPGPTTAIPAAAWSNMLPGDLVGQQVQLVNSGTTAATLSLSLAAASAWDIRVNWGACPTTQITNASLTTTPVVWATVPAGSSSTMCVQALLPATAAASVENTSANASVLIGVKQVAP